MVSSTPTQQTAERIKEILAGKFAADELPKAPTPAWCSRASDQHDEELVTNVSRRLVLAVFVGQQLKMILPPTEFTVVSGRERADYTVRIVGES